MNYYKRNNIMIIFNFKNLFAIISLMVAGYLLINTHDSRYQWYWLVPTMYAIILFIIPQKLFSFTRNVGLSILNITMIIRYIVSPLITCIGEYYSWRGLDVSGRYVNLGVFYIIYEMVFIFIILTLARKYIIKEIPFLGEIRPFVRKSGYTLLLILALGIVLVFPNLFSDYRFIFSTDTTTVYNETFSLSGLFKQIFEVGKLIFVIVIINYCHRRYLASRNNIYVLIPFLAIFISVLYVSHMSRFAILIPVVAFTYTMVMIFSDKQKFILQGIGTMLLLMIGFLTFYKFFGEGRGEADNVNSFHWWADIMQMYFHGPKNVGVAVLAEETNNPFKGIYRLYLLFNDTFLNVMGVSSFTDSSVGSITFYNLTYYGRYVRDQIVPAVGTGIYYFGSVLAPLWTGLFVYLAIIFGYKARDSKRTDQVFFYNYLSLCCGFILMMGTASIAMWSINFFLVFFATLIINKVRIR